MLEQFMKIQNDHPERPSIENKECVHSDHSLAAAQTLEYQMDILGLVSLTEVVTG